MKVFVKHLLGITVVKYKRQETIKVKFAHKVTVKFCIHNCLMSFFPSSFPFSDALSIH